MSDTRTAVRHQVAVGALTHHPVPACRTVSTTQTTGELSLRYIPRPTPAPEVSTDDIAVGCTCFASNFFAEKHLSDCPLMMEPLSPYAGCQVGDRVQIRPGYFGAGNRGTIIEKKGDEFIVSLDNWAKIRYSVHALEPVTAKSLLPCPDPATVVPRPGPDTLDYTSDPPVVPDSYRCQDCGAAGIRLYRKYQTILTCQHLRCRSCALKNQKMEVPDSPSEHTTGWLVAAIPTEDGATYWGYMSVPQAGVEWWNRLPKEPATASVPRDDTYWRDMLCFPV